MNSPLEAYARHARRIAKILVLLEMTLERHGERARDFDDPSRLWPMVGSLGHAEDELKLVLMFLSGTTEEDIDDTLNGKGQGDE